MTKENAMLIINAYIECIERMNVYIFDNWSDVYSYIYIYLFLYLDISIFYLQPNLLHE